MERENNDEYSFLFLLLSHHTKENLNRTLHLKIHGKDLYLCSRCSGIFIGLVVSVLFKPLLTEIISLNPLIILLLPAPAMTNWVLQTMKLHESGNSIRIATGFLLGVCWANMLHLLFTDWTNKILWLTTLLYAAIFLTVLPIRLRQAS